VGYVSVQRILQRSFLQVLNKQGSLQGQGKGERV
jgi:hypothetical protein